MKIYAANTALLKTKTEEELLVMLDEERREKVKKLKRQSDKDRAICAGVLLRYSFLQAGYTQKDWQEIRIQYGPYGKPILENYPNFHYSLSHSGDWVVCATDTVSVGVDIQEMKEWKDGVAKRFYHRVEYERLCMIEDEEEKKKQFYAMWAAKESYVKLTGRGIGEGIEQYVTEDIYQQIKDEAGEWLADIKIYETIPDYIVCVCTREKAKAKQLEIVEEIQE